MANQSEQLTGTLGENRKDRLKTLLFLCKDYT